jgi:N-acetylmuramic acid 6-phosphate (MurNAc-6-P) etherase
MERKFRSLTETPNPLTSDIDLASPQGIVKLLRQTDAQLFSGWATYDGFYDSPTIRAISDAALLTAEYLRKENGVIVLSGAGTSGRLAMFLAREFNSVCASLGKQPFRFLIAGGYPALIQAQEGAEDDPYRAQEDLKSIAGPNAEVLYYGITCGFSAPYIAGQLEYTLQQAGWHAVLVGFNPLELARTTAVENWPLTFKDTAEKVAAARNGSILNPIVGPEPITGSTRMKSGTATKILLEIVFSAACGIVKNSVAAEELPEYTVRCLRAYEEAYRTTYLAADSIGKVVEFAGKTLHQKGHIYYLGGAGRSQASTLEESQVDGGILGLIDASECPPTFGADFEDVRGFVEQGWRCLFPDGGVDLSPLAPHYQISLDDFRRTKLPTIENVDLCIFVGKPQDADNLIEAIRQRGARTVSVDWQGSPLNADVVIALPIQTDPWLGVAPIEMGIKLVLNAITTGGHVLAGKVFGNRMVDLRISNNKLFHRTIGIITDLMGVSAEEALEALLKSIFQTDNLTEAQREASVSLCIEKAKDVEKVVPKALLLATGKFTYQQACEALAKNPIVRSVISEYVR